MNSRYLVAIGDTDAVEINSLRFIDAGSEEEAIAVYRRQVLAIDALHRASVFSKDMNTGFAAQFWFTNKREDFHYRETGTVAVSDDVFRRRVMSYFTDQPNLCEMYLAYYFSDEEVSEEDFPYPVAEYIAVKDNSFTNVIALPLDEIEILGKSA